MGELKQKFDLSNRKFYALFSGGLEDLYKLAGVPVEITQKRMMKTARALEIRMKSKATSNFTPPTTSPTHSSIVPYHQPPASIHQSREIEVAAPQQRKDLESILEPRIIKMEMPSSRIKSGDFEGYLRRRDREELERKRAELEKVQLDLGIARGKAELASFQNQPSFMPNQQQTNFYVPNQNDQLLSLFFWMWFFNNR